MTMLPCNARRFGTRITTLLAIIATLVFLSVPAGSHALSLHASAPSLAEDAQSHSHGDHAHDDDLDGTTDEADATDHHHADHTHEKLGLVSSLGELMRQGLRSAFLRVDTSCDDGPLYGIDRPPRFVNRA